MEIRQWQFYCRYEDVSKVAKELFKKIKRSQTKYRIIVADPPWKYGTWGKASIPRSKTHIPKDEPMPYETLLTMAGNVIGLGEVAEPEAQ